MKSKYVGLGLLALGFCCAVFFLLQPFSLLAKTTHLPTQPVAVEQQVPENSRQGNGNSPKLVAIQLDREFKLKFNQEAVLEPNDLKLKFTKVLQDSRCPSQVQCMWQGQAKVAVDVWQNGKHLGEFVLLSQAGSPDLAIKKVDSESAIKLVDVQPYPSNPTEVKSADYVVTLVVSKIVEQQ